MEAKEKLIKTRIRLQMRNPFFSYLSLYLNFIKADKELEKFAGMGVNLRGDLFYHEEFVNKLSVEELEAVLSHEILHLALLHLTRRNQRDMMIWNISCDLAVNSVLRANNFKLPEGCLIPDQYNDEWEIPNTNHKIKDVSKKTAEQLYDEIYKVVPKVYVKNYYANGDGFDTHIEDKGSAEEKEKQTNEWIDRTEQAYVSAKQKGDMPTNLERLIGKLHESKVGWRSILQKYIQSLIPTDYSWAKPSKRSIATGYYLPDVIRERIKVCVGIDMSGSIGEKERTEFLSEIVAIAKAYQNKIEMRLITHDVEVHDDYLVENGNINKIMELKFHGGGGTNHKEISEYIDKEVKDTKAVLFFTDGESDLGYIDLKKFRFEPIFIISEQGTDRDVVNKYKTINLKEY